ncbi:MAG: hypothetical protein IPO78_11215 [Saprospiraceae bacterium]|nr:hypothetical protein [Saprospiraceae bacterium]MBK9722164.1 hypothetical protein [Saprospiraceae bacterium]
MKNENNNNEQKSKAIDFSVAQKMISDYKEVHGMDSDFLASEYYNLDDLRFILENPKCKGIRIFNCIKSEGDAPQNRLIIAGVDENGKIILNQQPALTGVSAAGLGFGMVFNNIVAAIAEHGSPCPPYCQ